MQIYVALIESKLLYSLSSMCLTVAGQRRFGGVQNKFVRSILGTKPAYYSRVSNADVLGRSGHTKATTLLLRRQLLLYGKILRTPEQHPMRKAAFLHGSSYPATSKYVRRSGRPRKEWVSSVQREICRKFGSLATADATCQDQARWKAYVLSNFWT